MSWLEAYSLCWYECGRQVLKYIEDKIIMVAYGPGFEYSLAMLMIMGYTRRQTQKLS